MVGNFEVLYQTETPLASSRNVKVEGDLITTKRSVLTSPRTFGDWWP